jgi:hypothetical protein
MSSTSSWTIVHQEESSDHSSDVPSLRNALEKGNEDVKIQTMQKILVIMINGDPLPSLLMHVIRFVCSYNAVLIAGYAEQEQAPQKALTLLLGNLSKDQSRWQIEAGDDPRLQCPQKRHTTSQ